MDEEDDYPDDSLLDEVELVPSNEEDLEPEVPALPAPSPTVAPSATTTVTSTPPSLPSTSSTPSASRLLQKPVVPKQGSSKKRSHAALEGSESDGEISDSHEGRRIRSRTAGAKEGSSWAKQKVLKAKSKSKNFVPNAAKFNNFKKKILKDDDRAKFGTKNSVSKVWCSSCAKWLEMKALYDYQRWDEHRATKACKSRQSSGLSQLQVGDFFSARPKSQPKERAETPPEDPPCPGLSLNSYPLVRRYLRRVSTPGGGAPSRHRIAKALWPKLGEERSKWKHLSLSRRGIVLRREQTLYAWINHFETGTVASSHCAGTRPVSSADTPCESCSSLLSLHTFQNQLNKKMPKEENMKYVPKEYRNKVLGEIYLKYKGVRQLLEAVSHILDHLHFTHPF